MTRLTETELAQRWSMTTRTLQSWRKAGTGPAFIRLGERSIFYRTEDVLGYEESRVVGKVAAWRGPVKRAAGVLDVLAAKSSKAEAKAMICKIRDELRALLA